MKAHMPLPLPRHFRRAILIVFVLATNAGCALIEPVQPWEKGTLARPEMTFQGDSLDLLFTEHIHASREGASGGAGTGGGGCGCY